MVEVNGKPKWEKLEYPQEWDSSVNWANAGKAVMADESTTTKSRRHLTCSIVRPEFYSWRRKTAVYKVSLRSWQDRGGLHLPFNIKHVNVPDSKQIRVENSE